ncbi:MAG: hypothetical protein D6812_00085 [Deltaproteobacteria bacterium]|nr:MAG: hypothetical protein D6812_00085 [Deltaproteobacteria bacterium]
MKNKLAFVLVALFLLPAVPSPAAPPDHAVDLIKHLEFLGYDVSMDSERIIAKHSKHLNILLKKYRGGILVTAYFGGSAYGKQHRTEWLSVINALNQEAAAARYYLDGDGDLIIEGYYPGDYDKKSFGLFIETFNLEGMNLAKKSNDLMKYLE